MNICNVCNFSVRPRQEYLQCEGCYRWQHRSCDTGISRAQYRAAVQSGEGIDWSCQMCKETSTRMEEDMASLISDPSIPYASLPEPESFQESGTPLFSDENTFGTRAWPSDGLLSSDFGIQQSIFTAKITVM
ncbi:uncharacterized protein LOC110043493 isoform X2 [Orbicella faveolata]|uniref:uncharacterized protein LOC110043493 isoform X2 n=1 Tax=Orbicella faveolata TaxID=48498 RepID=UPI0009E3B1AA|nr:uncharacterized protein LOC110043493 isoform X2 [Orbicella faveolata]